MQSECFFRLIFLIIYVSRFLSCFVFRLCHHEQTNSFHFYAKPLQSPISRRGEGDVPNPQGFSWISLTPVLYITFLTVLWRGVDPLVASCAGLAHSPTQWTDKTWIDGYVRSVDCRSHYALVNYFPISSMIFRYSKSAATEGIVNRYGHSFLTFFITPTWRIPNSVEEIAKKRGISMAQVSVAWCLSKEGVPTLPLFFFFLSKIH
jgi:hypothetical protein